MKKLVGFSALMLLALGLPHRAVAQPQIDHTSRGTFYDTGNSGGGYFVSVGTITTVNIAAAASTTGILYRLRAFQNTGAFDVLCSTFTPVTFASSPGWLITKNSGSWATSAQDAFYCIADPAAGVSLMTIRGRYEFQTGDRP